MNATLPVLNVTIPNAAVAAVGSAPGPAAASGAKTRDFASVLGSAGKSADRKAPGPQAAQPAPVGQPMPVVGNPPPPLPPVTAADASAAAAAAAAALNLAAAVTPPPAAANSAATAALAGSPSGQAAAITAASADQAQLAKQGLELRQQTQAGRAALAANAAAATPADATPDPAGATSRENALAAQDPSSQPLASALPTGANDGASTAQIAAAKALATADGAAALAQAGAKPDARAARGGASDARVRTAPPAPTPKSSTNQAEAAAAAAARSADAAPAAQAAASTDPTLSALGSSFGAQLQADYTDSISGPNASTKSGVAAAGAASAAASAAPIAAAATADVAAAAVAQPPPGVFAAALATADKPGRDASIAAAGGAAAASATSSAAGPNGTDAGSAAAAASANQAAAAASAGAPSSLEKIDAGINTPEFSQALADRVSYMAGNNLNGATLQVTPPQLGPIELRVSVENGHAQVWLSAHSPATLDALQSSTPKLREMLSSQGFVQVSVDVSQRSFQDRSAYPQNSQWTPTPDRDATAAATPISAGAMPRAAQGMLDAYA
jgi:flagellar hook-length control protein FliK